MSRRHFFVPLRFECTPALWFRVPLRALTLAVAALGLFAIAPSLADTAARDRAIAGLAVVALFVVASSVVTAAVADSYAEVDGDTLVVRFETVFNAGYSLADIAVVRRIDSPAGWRHALGLSTDWRERIILSHGGPLVEIEFGRAQPTRLFRRRIELRRIWLAVRDPDAFIEAVTRAARASDRSGA